MISGRALIAAQRTVEREPELRQVAGEIVARGLRPSATSSAPGQTWYPADVKIATWNVNGIRARFSEVLRWIDREEPDVICLQETKASPEQVPEELFAVAGYHSHWHGHKGYSGVALHAAHREVRRRAGV